MTKLEELRAALITASCAARADAAAWDAAKDANAAAYAANAAAYAAYAAAWDARNAARDAYEAELKKQKEKQNELELSTNEAHRTGR